MYACDRPAPSGSVTPSENAPVRPHRGRAVMNEQPMSTNESAAQNGSAGQFDERDARALTQYMTTLDDLPRVRGAPGLYVVVSPTGTYGVDPDIGACECPDAEYRDPAGGCKHVRRVRFATGERAIPAWVDPDAVDPDLGEHVDGEVRVDDVDGPIATDGGRVETDDDVDLDRDRPDDCECSEASRRVGIPCFPCYLAGFATPAGAETGGDGDAEPDVVCKALECGAPATHTVVVNAPGRGYAEDPACAEHAEDSRDHVYVREVRAGYEGGD